MSNILEVVDHRLSTHSAAQLGMTTADKVALVFQVAEDLGIGGWACGGAFDCSSEDVERAWALVEEPTVDSFGVAPPALAVAACIAGEWAAGCFREPGV